jgi:hypothetical protein
MPQLFVITGGARVGWTYATWPLAKLSAGPDKLTVSTAILGTYSFAPDEVSAVERYVIFPVLGSGVRIRHCKTDCPERVIFWHLGSPDAVLRGIHDSGFQPAASAPASSEPRGIPFRWSAIIIAIAVWNALFFLDGSPPNRDLTRAGPLILAPLAFAFALAAGTLRSSHLQRLILKPGRTVGEVRPLLRLLAFISGLLLVIFSVLLARGAFNNAPGPHAGF